MAFTKHFHAAAALALGAIASSSGVAFAGGEVIYGGVRTAGAAVAVPVPAPVPVPDISTGFYVRLDAIYSQGDISKYKSTDPYVDNFRSDARLDNFARFGFGVGYYFNQGLRGDITFDKRSNVSSKGTGTRDYTIPNGNGGTSQMRDTYSDNFSSSNWTGLINLYADMPVHPLFTPYVGAGIGFVRHQLKGRSFARNVDCFDLADCDPSAGVAAGPSAISSFSTTAGGVDYALAAAAMAGFSYKIWDNTKIDLGYRWLHLQGATFTGRNNNVVENLKIPDQNIHEVRAGLRFDIN